MPALVPDAVSRRLQTPLLIGRTAFDIGKAVSKAVAGKALALPLRLLSTATEAFQPADDADAVEFDVIALPPNTLPPNTQPGATLDHADLPLEDFDHLTLGQLRSRIRTLDTVALVQLLDYEKVHADRLPVTLALQNRIDTLSAEALV